MDIPLFEYHDFLEKGVAIVTEALMVHGSARVASFPDPEHNEPLLSAARALGELQKHSSSKTTGSASIAGDEYVAVIRPFSKTLHSAYGQAVLSQTNLLFPSHTDEYFLQTPSNIIVLLCCRADEYGGGETLLTHVDDLVSVLSCETRSVLQTRSFPHPSGPVAVLSVAGERWALRYNRHYMNGLLQAGSMCLSQAQLLALNELEAAIDRISIRLLLQNNDCLFINNTRILHGRTAFSLDSGRLFKRVRIRAQLARPENHNSSPSFPKAL